METDQLRADDLYNTPLDPRLQVDAFASMSSSHEPNVITIPFYPETPMHFSVPFMPWIQQSPIPMHSHPLTPSSISPPAVPAGPTPLIPVADALPQPSPALPPPPPPAEAIEQSPSPPVHSQAISSDGAVPSPVAELTPTATEKKKSKKRPESHDVDGNPIPKRPVGRPRKDGKPAGSQGPRKTNRPPGRPRKHPIPNGTTTMSINSSSSSVKQLGSLSQMGTPQSSGGDANPYSPLGPDQASTSAMSLDQPDPSTLSFSQSESSGTPAYDDPSCPAGAMMDQDFNDMSISHSPDASRSVTSPSMLSSVTCTSASDWTDAWSEQEITNADAFLETLVSLLSSLPSPSPSSSSSSPCSSSSMTTATASGIIPHTLEQSFKIRLTLVRRQSTRAPSLSSSTHLHQHQPQPQSQLQHHSYLPRVYDLFQSFWLSSSSPYFARTVSPSLQVPSEHRFFFWHPMPLCPGATIICPSCGTAPLMDKGPIASGPVRIWDFEPCGRAGAGGGFYVIGCEYVCRSAVCIAAAATDDTTAVNGSGRTFASTDNAILRSLPQALQDDFPAFMMTTHGTREVWDFRTVGVSRAVWVLARSLVLRVKMGKQMVVQVLAGMQQQQGLGSGMGEPDEPWLRDERGLQYQQRQQHQEHHQQEEEDAFGEMRRSSLDHGVEEQSPVRFLHHHHHHHPQHQHQQLHQHQHQQTASGYAAFMSSNQSGMYDQGGLGHSLEGAGYGHMTHHAEPDSELPYEIEHSPLAASSVQSPQTSQSKSPSSSSVAATATPSSSASSTTMATAPTPTSTTTSVPVEYDGPLTYPTQTYYAMSSATGSPHEYDFSQQYGPSPPPTGLIDAITQVPKKLRHCCKCGQISCKGKGGRTHCQNRCQDCHRFECRGRNSKRPDKTCEFAWTE